MKSNSALLVIDLQAGMFESPLIPPVYQGDGLLARIGHLIAKARRAQVPVIYVQHSGGRGHPLEHGTAGWQIHPSVAPLAGEAVIHKRTPDSFHETNLQCELDTQGIRRLVMTGIQTDFCVDTTCRRAFSLGYEVILVKDGHSTWDHEALTAPQVIAHHNYVLGFGFAQLREASEIGFDEPQG
jgi:nicotinamidase-related amidase